MYELGNIHGLPHLTLAFGSDHRDTSHFAITDRARVEEAYQYLQLAARFYARWIVTHVEISIRKGEQSTLNFGALFGLSQQEFLSRVAPETLQENIAN